MISAEQNDRITRVGPGTPAGTLLRHYWQPVALSDELAGPRPVKAVRLMGQDFVLFRDEQGRIGLLDRRCPHRAADLSYGRREDGGLRCLFHGWLFDVTGQCIDTPGEPEGSRLCEHIRQPSYPVVEKSGIVFAWIGRATAAQAPSTTAAQAPSNDDDPPAFPDFDCFVAPGTHTFAFKGHFACNWLQALEVGIDPAHASFLHRFFKDEDTSAAYGRQFRGASAGTEIPMTRVLREYARPDIRAERSPWGMRITALRRLSEVQTHVRVTNLYFPQAFVIPMSAEMTITQWHVPVDDENCYWYAIFTSFGAPVDKDRMRAQRLELYELPDYLPRRNRANDWGYDPKEQAAETFTGMGFDINVHDQWACESMGAIQDRTKENLGSTDKAIVLYRRLLNQAIDVAAKGETPLMKLGPADAAGLTGPETLDGVAPADAWESYWKDTVAKRRAAASWKR